jgi:hypothetical protein
MRMPILSYFLVVGAALAGSLFLVSNQIRSNGSLKASQMIGSVASTAPPKVECPESLAREAMLRCQLKLYAERRKHEIEFQERCKPTEYKGRGGVTYLEYAKSDCVGRILSR